MPRTATAVESRRRIVPRTVARSPTSRTPRFEAPRISTGPR